MKEILKLVRNKELIVRKRIANFLEKLLKFYENDDVRHDLYKGIVYSEIEAVTFREEKYKNLYDGLMYLLHNKKSPFSKELLSKFFYIIYKKEMDESLLIRITSKLFFINDLPIIEKMVEFHLFIYQELKDLEEEERTIISLMFMNYILVRHNIPCIQLLKVDINKYLKCREEYFSENNKINIFMFFCELLKKGKYQDKDFYKNLRYLDFHDIFQVIEKEKELLMKKYKIKHLYVYGSFAKNTQRIDSDIDFIARFSLDLTFDEKIKYIQELSEHYKDIFNRYIDFHDIGDYLNDAFLKEVVKIKKLF